MPGQPLTVFRSLLNESKGPEHRGKIFTAVLWQLPPGMCVPMIMKMDGKSAVRPRLDTDILLASTLSHRFKFSTRSRVN